MAKQYRYAIRASNGQYFKVVYGVVRPQVEPHYYYEGIDDFGELGISEYRNVRMAGFFRNISQKPYAFIDDMKIILRFIMFTYGTQYKATLRVERMNSYQHKTYKLDYETEINLTTAMRERHATRAELLQGGVEELIKSREDAEYRLPVRGDGVVRIAIQPFRVRGRSYFITSAAPGQVGHGPNRVAEKYNWPGLAQFKETVVEVLDSPTYRPIDYFSPLAALVNETIEFGQQYNELNALGNFQGYSLLANVRLEKVTMNFTLPVYIKNLDSSSVSFRLRIYRADATSTPNWASIAESTNIITVAAGTDTSQSFTMNAEFSLDANKVVHVIMENLTPSVTNVEWQYEPQVPMTIEFEHYTSAFEVTGINWGEAAKRMSNLITDNQASFKSDLLTRDITYKEGIDCKPTHLALLSSDTIKGITGPRMFVSWTNFLKATDVMLCAGCGLERSYDSAGGVKSIDLRLERRSYFYKEQDGNGINLIADLGNPAANPEQTVTFAQDEAYNELHIGYRGTDTDDINGPYEYNTTLKLQTNYTKDKNIKDLISPISASGMAIYRKFIRYATGQDTDKGNDNDLFVLQYSTTANSSGVYSALYPTEIKPGISATDIRGMLDPLRSLNAGITPKRNYIRRAYYEIGFFYDSNLITDTYKLKYLTIDKNPSFVSKLTSTYFIGETTDEDLHDTLLKYGQSRLFYPFYIDTSHNPPDNIRQLWESKRNGVFSVQIDGNTYYGFPNELHEKNAKPKLLTFKLMLSASNNLMNLI